MGGFKRAVRSAAKKDIPVTLVDEPKTKPKSKARLMMEQAGPMPKRAAKAPARAAAPLPARRAPREAANAAAAARARGYTKRERAFRSWSFTAWAAWYECPLAAALSRIDKLDKHLPQGPALIRGRELDEATERFITKRDAKLHPELMPAKTLLTQWRNVKPAEKVVQENWGYNSAWEPVSSTDWDNCKLRIKLDFGHLKGTHLDIWDAKTGKYREEQNDKYEMQLDLYIAGAFAQIPHLETATARLLYTDFNIVFPEPAAKLRVYTRAEAEAMQKAWDRRVKPMLADRSFKPKPSFRCRYCNFRKGGPVGGCKY